MGSHCGRVGDIGYTTVVTFCPLLERMSRGATVVDCKDTALAASTVFECKETALAAFTAIECKDLEFALVAKDKASAPAPVKGTAIPAVSPAAQPPCETTEESV
jgi:hypothetical protein